MNQIKTTNNQKFPFPLWAPFIVGAFYGLVLRIIFSGHLGQSLIAGGTSFTSSPIFETTARLFSPKFNSSLLDVMTIAFVALVPFAVGAITVYIAERQRRRSFEFYIIVGPWVSVGLLMLGTGILLFEGSICIAMAMPLFLFFGSLGGLVMGLVCRLTKHATSAVNGIAILPFLFAFVEATQPLTNYTHEVKTSIHIASTPEVIWQYINFPSDIKPSELGDGFAYKIGVPYPVEARTITPEVGGIRKSIWQRGVTFDELIEQYEENSFIQWRYIFSSDSFPAGSMDDHVMIGGRYFDLENTSYKLTPEQDGTRLEISVKYRVTTNFNWYAAPWADFLITNTANTILNFYKNRAEHQSAQIASSGR